MKDFSMKVSPISQGLNEGEVVMCTVTNKSYLFANKQLNAITQSEDKLAMIPQWLFDDVKRLNLEDVRLSCAIYELYDYYANTFVQNLPIDESSALLDLYNERLDWIDDNSNLIKYAINKM